MLSGATLSAAATVGTAVFRMVVSSASMKKATATSHGSSRLTDSSGEGGGGIDLVSERRAMHDGVSQPGATPEISAATPISRRTRTERRATRPTHSTPDRD